MATLLDLVDQYIGDVLAGNIYGNNVANNILDQNGNVDTNKNVYSDTNVYIAPINSSPLGAAVPPVNTEYSPSVRKPSSVDTNKQYSPDIRDIPRDHPHESIPNIIPGPSSLPPSKMHGPPPMLRPEIYQLGVDRPTITPEQVDASKVLDTHLSREDIYLKSNSLDKVSPPLPDISTDQRTLIENDSSFTKGQSFDSQRRNDRYTQDFVDANRKDVPGAVFSNAKQVVSNIGGTPQSKPTIADQMALLGKPPGPSLNFNGPKANDVPENIETTLMPKPLIQPSRNDIYLDKDSMGVSSTPNGVPPSPSLNFSGPRVGDVPSNLTPEPLIQPSRNDIYRDIDSTGIALTPNGVPPSPSLNFSGPRVGDVPSNLTPEPIVQPSRNDIYLDKDSSGVALTPNGRPPTDLLSTIPTNAKRQDFAPIEGQIANSFQSAHKMGNIYDDGDITLTGLTGRRGGPYSQSSYGLLKGFDIWAIAHWFRGIGKEFGIFQSQNNNGAQSKLEINPENIVKGSTWLASQFLLASLNPGDAQGYGLGNMIWNPLSLPLSLVPFRGATAASNITAGAAFSDYKTRAETAGFIGNDRLLLMRQGAYIQVSPVSNLLKHGNPISKPGFFGDITKTGETDTLDQGKIPYIQGLSIGQQVDGDDPIEQAKIQGRHTNIYGPEQGNGPGVRRYSLEHVASPQAEIEDFSKKNPAYNTPADIKLQSLFLPRAYPGASNPMDFGNMSYDFLNRSDNSSFKSITGLSTPNNIDAAFSTDDANKGYIEGKPNATESPLPDSELYMPFMFQDLRDDPPRFLYFRAFLKEGLSEMFTPEWQTERFYGRVDAIPVYMGTNRTINVAFDVVAFSVKDLDVIYKKLDILQSMVYPEYNVQGFLNRGPIIKMRIGDLIAGNKKQGLPGYITSLSFDYDDGIWNITEDYKVPRKISVTLAYTVIHEGNPGIYPSDLINIDVNGSGSLAGNKLRIFGAASVTNDNNTTKIEVSKGNIRKIAETTKYKPKS